MHSHSNVYMPWMRMLLTLSHVPESSPTPSHMHMPSVKTIIGVSPNDLTHWTTLQYLFNFIKSCVFLWANFRGLIAGFACLLTLSRTFIIGYICPINNKIWVFYPGGGGGGGGGDLLHLASSKHMRFIIIIVLHS